MEDFGSVVKVPGKLKSELLEPCKDPQGFGLVMTSEDEQSWEEVPEEITKNLKLFVAGYFPGAPSKSWKSSSGQRFGWNTEGVFVNQEHQKRFFGIRRESASPLLRAEVPEAVPKFIGPSDVTTNDPTDRMLQTLITRLPDISNDMRQQVLKATFTTADINGNGVLSRAELGTMFRKLVNTMSAAEIEALMREADKDNSNSINYSEFVDWLQASAPDKVKEGLHKAMRSEADIIKASFRVWDKDGDGLIPLRQLERMLGKTVKNMSDQQVKSLCALLDSDHDGNIDYDEFVDFLFFTAKRQN